jgi:hypothetical protein
MIYNDGVPFRVTGNTINTDRRGKNRGPAAKYLFKKGHRLFGRYKPKLKIFIRGNTDVYETVNNIATWRKNYTRLTGEG